MIEFTPDTKNTYEGQRVSGHFCLCALCPKGVGMEILHFGKILMDSRILSINRPYEWGNRFDQFSIPKCTRAETLSMCDYIIMIAEYRKFESCRLLLRTTDLHLCTVFLVEDVFMTKL